MPPPKLKFTVGERLLCFHNPLLYEARCIGYEWTKQKMALYRIHYMGWNKSHDAWVEDNRLFKLTEGNLQRKKVIEEAVHSEVLKMKNNPRRHRRIDKRVLKAPQLLPAEDPPGADAADGEAPTPPSVDTAADTTMTAAAAAAKVARERRSVKRASAKDDAAPRAKRSCVKRVN